MANNNSSYRPRTPAAEDTLNKATTMDSFPFFTYGGVREEEEKHINENMERER